MSSLNKAYLLIGGNMGNRHSNLQQARELIQKECGQITAKSSIYQTAAWGLTDQPDFLNQVLVVTTLLTPEALMQTLLSIEERMGRKRTIKMGPRIIDLDILLIDSRVIYSTLLTIPHPALPKRKFALIPLFEVAPQLMHPLERKTITQLLTECPDELAVQKIYDPTA